MGGGRAPPILVYSDYIFGRSRSDQTTDNNGRGGVLEDILGLEDTFWRPWPRSLKSSKIALSSARGQHYFWTAEISLENARNLAKNLQRPFFWFPQVEIAWKKILKTFFFENTCVCVLGPWPWPREGLSLASKFFCVLVLGLEPCVLDYTSE